MPRGAALTLKNTRRMQRVNENKEELRACHSVLTPIDSAIEWKCLGRLDDLCPENVLPTSLYNSIPTIHNGLADARANTSYIPEFDLLLDVCNVLYTWTRK